MRMGSTKSVRNMTRVKHNHTYHKNVQINGRDVCDSCPYRVPRFRYSGLGTKRVLDRAAEVLRNAPMASEYTDPNKFTVPVLRELVSRNRPDLKGVSKMRKLDLVAALLKS